MYWAKENSRYLSNNTQKWETSAMGAFAFISHLVASSQQPHANVDLVSHPLIKMLLLCASQTVLFFSPHNDCLFASCLWTPSTRSLELKQEALANIFQMSVFKAWHLISNLLFRSCEHQNLSRDLRKYCCSAFCGHVWIKKSFFMCYGWGLDVTPSYRVSITCMQVSWMSKICSS